MAKVTMNGMVLEQVFESVELAKKYITSAKKVDKKYKAKNDYKVIVVA